MSYQTEEEQLELIKSLWNRYGSILMTGLITILLVVYGNRYWQERTHTNNANAADQYVQILTLVEAEQPLAKWQEKADAYLLAHPDSPYAALLSLMLAKAHIESADYGAAMTSMQWAINHAEDEGLKEIARIRLARLYYANNELTQALETLSSVHLEAFDGSKESVKGDIYSAQGDNKLAKTAYESALAHVKSDELRQELEMKINAVNT